MKFSREDTKVMKGIAIILMLYHHLFRFPERIADTIQYIPLLTRGDISTAYLLGDFGKLCVALFLFLSGYGTFLSFRKHSEDDAASTRIVLAKVKNLYKEYWKVFVIFVPICLLVGVERVAPEPSALFWNFTGLSITYCGEWWFFTPYIALLLIYPIFRRLIYKQRTVFHDIFAVLLLSGFSDHILPGLSAYQWAATLSQSLLWHIFRQTLSLAPVFYMGCIFAKYDLLTLAKERFLSGWKTVILAGIALLAVFFMRRNQGSAYDFLFAPVTTVACTLLLNFPVFKWFRWILEKIGQESTTIWLVHSIFCYLLCQEFVFLPRYTVLIFLWLLLLSFATSIALRKLFDLPSSLRKRRKA